MKQLLLTVLVLMVLTVSAQQPLTIRFSGYTWNVKNPGTPQGPGPNHWSSNNVRVDSAGRLHLKISKAENGQWVCGEVFTKEKFGYGTYQWQVEGPLNALDKNIVLGLFNYSGSDGLDEMDIEFARWGNDSFPILNYTVWPAVRSDKRNDTYGADFKMGTLQTTHRFKRSQDSIAYTSLHGYRKDDKDIFERHTFYAPATSISKLPMPVYMNLWLFQGMAPSDGKEVELIIHNFSFIPL